MNKTKNVLARIVGSVVDAIFIVGVGMIAYFVPLAEFDALRWSPSLEARAVYRAAVTVLTVVLIIHRQVRRWGKPPLPPPSPDAEADAYLAKRRAEVAGRQKPNHDT